MTGVGGRGAGAGAGISTGICSERVSNVRFAPKHGASECCAGFTFSRTAEYMLHPPVALGCGAQSLQSRFELCARRG